MRILATLIVVQYCIDKNIIIKQYSSQYTNFVIQSFQNFTVDVQQMSVYIDIYLFNIPDGVSLIFINTVEIAVETFKQFYCSAKDSNTTTHSTPCCIFRL